MNSVIRIAALLAFALPVIALADRNGSGTFTLAPGNPVVSRTTITSTWANSTLSDIGINLTSSLDRSGRGGMLAPLQLFNGTLGAPGLTWAADLASGLYRIGSQDFGFALNAVLALELANAGLTWTTPGTGNGVTFTAGTLGAGLRGNGAGSGHGVVGVGGATGKGGNFQGGASGAIGVTGTGTGTFAGGTFANGTAATGGTRQNAISALNGDIDLSGVTNPSQTTALTNVVTPANLVKAFGVISTPGGNSTTCTVVTGVNVSSCAAVNNTADSVHITFPSPGFTNDGNQSLIAQGWEAGANFIAPFGGLLNSTTGYIEGVYLTTAGPTVVALNCYAVACRFTFVVVGTQ